MVRGSQLDVRPVLSHPLFLFTLIISIIGWFTAFIGQSILEAKFHAIGGKGSAVGVPWFGIFLQLWVIVSVFYTLATDSVGGNRFQLSIFLAMTVVFAVLGVNSGIYNSTSFQLAIGAGWLLLSFVDLIWLLYFTSEEDSFYLRLFNSASSTTFSRSNNQSNNPGHSRRNQNRNSSSGVMGISTSGNLNSQQSNASMNQSGLNHQSSNNNRSNGLATSYGQGNYSGVSKMASTNNLGENGMSTTDLGMGGGEDGRSGSPAGTTGGGSLLGAGGDEYTLKARALYSYTASADDPNEISFAKGEILDIVDNSGKWWRAKGGDGRTGIVPSNYLTTL